MAAAGADANDEVEQSVTNVTLDSTSHDIATLSSQISVLKSSTNPSCLLSAVRTIWETISTNDDDELETYIVCCLSQNIIPCLISLLESSDTELCFESARILTVFTDTSNGDHSQSLINAGVLDVLFKCMTNTTHTNVKDQCCSVLNNISEENVHWARLFLTPDYMKTIASTVDCFIEVGNWDGLSKITQTVRNIFQYKLFDDFKVYIPVVSACYNILPLIGHTSYIFLFESLLLIFANLAEHFEDVYDLLITKEMTFGISNLLHHHNDNISYATFTFLGNLCAGWCPFLVEILDKLDLVTPIFGILENSSDIFHKQEVLWFFGNVISDSQESLQFCFDKDIYTVIIKYLTHEDHDLFM
ncbi:hypothetical protein GEMRC1_001573 [Eukaryota sp. GEM-RC1]